MFGGATVAGGALGSVLTAILPVLCAILAGAVMRRVNWLTAEADASMMRVTINVFTPCLIFDSVLGNRALDHPGTLLLAPAIGFLTVILGIFASLAIAPLAGLEGDARRRTFAVSTGIYNYGYIPLPLALALFNRETAGVLFVHNIGVEAAMWSAGMIVLSGHGLKDGWRKVVNVPLIAILIALLLNTTGVAGHLPGFVVQTARLLGQCAIPLGLVLIGATMSDYAHEFRVGGAGQAMGAACLMRLGILPVAFLLLAWVLPCSLELRRVVLLQAAMPAAVFPIIMAKHYGGDAGTALRIVLATSVGAIITIPLWLRLGGQFLGISW
jgi:predicted permease